jgi:hypothetical protein
MRHVVGRRSWARSAKPYPAQSEHAPRVGAPQLGSVGVPEADSMRAMFPDPGDAEPPAFQPLPGNDSADALARRAALLPCQP